MLLDRGLRVFGSVRKQPDLDRLKATFCTNFTPLLFDVTDEAAVLAAAREVRAALDGATLAGLVNNAGIGITGPLLELSSTEFRRQMEVNLIGPIMATQAFGPLLGSDESLTGRIDVNIVAPGIVKTPIWSKADGADISAYRNSPQFPALEKLCKFMLALGEAGLPPERIAECVAEALMSKSPKVRYSIAPDQKQQLVMAVLPKRAVDTIFARRLGLSPPTCWIPADISCRAATPVTCSA
jgi:NAD(P)-dependent dehydrogenase (short-subunit alcohol dehydrogenase family)